MEKDLKTKFLELTRMKYAEQATWFMNAFWSSGIQGDAEAVWKFGQKFIELDQKKKEGNELDEFWAHKFLESFGETLTVIQLRERLRQIDMDANGKMALLEYLLFKYSKLPKDVINAPQGDNSKELEEAQAKMQAVQDALTELQNQLEEQKRVVADQKKKAGAADKALADQKASEEAVRRSEEENRQAVEALKAQEDAYHSQVKELERKAGDSSASTVAKSKAANELAQLKGENPLPLRKAKITQEATLRKVEKERKAAEAATAIAVALKNEADAAARHAEAQARQVEEAVRDTETRYQEAVNFLEEVKRKGGVAYGSIWWMEREMKEMQKYLPQKRQQN